MGLVCRWGFRSLGLVVWGGVPWGGRRGVIFGDASRLRQRGTVGPKRALSSRHILPPFLHSHRLARVQGGSRGGRKRGKEYMENKKKKKKVIENSEQINQKKKYIFLFPNFILPLPSFQRSTPPYPLPHAPPPPPTLIQGIPEPTKFFLSFYPPLFFFLLLFFCC